MLLWVRLILFFLLLLTLAEDKSSAVDAVPTAVEVCQLLVFPTFLASLLLPVYHAADVPALAGVPTVDNIPITVLSHQFRGPALVGFLCCSNISPVLLWVLQLLLILLLLRSLESC